MNLIHAHTLFIGDSITDAFRKPEEINPAFQLGNGYAFLIAARLWYQFPELGLQFTNRGISGNGLQELEGRWRQDCLDLQPNLISILVGVNETIRHYGGGSNLDLQVFEAKYDQLVQSSAEQLPGVALVIVEPFLLPCGAVTPQWQEHLRERALAARRVAARAGAIFVETQSALTAACASAPPQFWAYDGIHLTAAGFELLGRLWLEKVYPGLPLARGAVESLPGAGNPPAP